MLMRRWILGLSACLLVTGCGDDTAFTKSEAAALAEVVWYGATAPVLDVFDTTTSSSYDLEVECTKGGKAQTSGTMEGDDPDRTFAGTSTFTDCAEFLPPCFRHHCPVDPVVTLNGDVHRKTEVALIRSDGWVEIDVEGRLFGEFAWETDYGESGICELDLIAVSEVVIIRRPVYEIREEGRMSGTVCGTPVDMEEAPGGLWGGRPIE